jgi:septum formation protein
LKKLRIVLASQSPRRKILLRQIGVLFTTHPSHIPEDFIPGQSARRNAGRIALAKAVEVSKHYKAGVVVGADTIVVVGKRLLAKPSSKADAIRMLRLLSGREHVVITAFALVDCRTGHSVVEVERTKVRFRRIGLDEIKSYVASGSPMDKAGAYGIQDDYGAVFVERVNGCFYNVVGLPLAKFHTTLRAFLRQRQN